MGGKFQSIGLLVFVVTVLAGAPRLHAHHAFSAEFDPDKPITLKGKVSKVLWTNPHAWIYVDVVDKNGKVITWMVEGGPPNALVKRGWRKDSLAVGTEILVEGFRARNGTPTANGSNVTLPDGKVLFVGSSGTGAPYDKPGER